MARCPLVRLDHVGPLCRTVTDCAVFTQAIAGHDPDDPTTSRAGGRLLGRYRRRREGTAPWRAEQHFFDDVDDDVRSDRGEYEVFRKLGAEIVEVEVPGIKHGFALGEVRDALRPRRIIRHGCANGRRTTARRRAIV